MGHPAGAAESTSSVDLGLLGALAAGRVDDAGRRLRDLDLDELTHTVAQADLDLRRGGATVDLMGVAARVEGRADAAPLLRWWTSAILGEWCAFNLDLAGVRLAAAALDDMPDHPLAPVPVLWVRGRLRRLAGALHLAGHTPDRAGHRRLRDEAISDFLRCGFPEEVAVTRVVAAATEALWLWEDPEGHLRVAAGAREMLGDGEDSAWSPFVDLLVAVLAMVAGDAAEADRSLTDAEKAAVVHPVVAAYARHMGALHELTTGPSASTETVVQQMTEAFAALSRTDPLIVHHLRLLTAQALVDGGHGAAARRLATPALDMPGNHRIDDVDRHVLDLRLRLYEGDDVPLETLVAALDEYAAMGHPSRVTGTARRLADDLSRLGHPEKAATLGAAVGLQAGPEVRLRVMAPVLDITVEGRPVPLRTTAARLLLALVVAHPEPVHVEAAADTLWPDTTWGATRRRLNMVVHRLRRSLGEAGPAVRRTGDLLALDTAGWDVDLLHVRRTLLAATASDAGTDGVLDEIEGNLCHVQFPYDENLVEERQVLLATAHRTLGHPRDATERTRRAQVLRALGAP